MAITEFTAALNQVASERNINPEDVINTLKEALVAAYKKDHPEVLEEEDLEERLKADIDPDTGEIKILLDGKDVTPAGFGRIASQTAKQVILQKIREAEKNAIAEEYRERIGTLTQGFIFRIDNDTVVMDLGKTHGILPVAEQIPRERYSVNQKYKVLIKDVVTDEKSGASTIILSRRDPLFIEKLFEQEVPEITKGIVKIESIAREAGERTKVAVSSSDSKIDPSGACIGQKGVRVQAVTDELNGEKIDIINYSSSPDRFIAAALAPAHVIDVVVNTEEKSALVKVAEDQLSLAIGNKGQNARLAAKLTGYRISIDGSDVVDITPETTEEDMKDMKIPEKAQVKNDKELEDEDKQIEEITEALEEAVGEKVAEEVAEEILEKVEDAGEVREVADEIEEELEEEAQEALKEAEEIQKEAEEKMVDAKTKEEAKEIKEKAEKKEAEKLEEAQIKEIEKDAVEEVAEKVEDLENEKEAEKQDLTEEGKKEKDDKKE